VSRPRFHVPEAAPGARVVLPEHTAHHAREVLRLKEGAAASVFDGRGAEFAATLDEVSRRRVSARVGKPLRARPESPRRLILAVSPLRGDRMELVIQKATELGVTEIWPVVTARTDAAARPALKGTRQKRWYRVVGGATEQCGRATVPHVEPTTTLDGLFERAFEGTRAVLLEKGDYPPLATLKSLDSLLILVGPAGGFEPAEVPRLLDAGFAPVSLGPRILRSETAAITAVALAQALWGDLGWSPEC
jgi:16S rRNA (uracil1498-N3)-methyltransferase